MKIDFVATRKKFDEACLSQAKLGRSLGIDRSVVSHILAGRYRSMHGKSAQAIFAELRNRGVLVEVQDDEAA